MFVSSFWIFLRCFGCIKKDISKAKILIKANPRFVRFFFTKLLSKHFLLAWCLGSTSAGTDIMGLAWFDRSKDIRNATELGYVSAQAWHFSTINFIFQILPNALFEKNFEKLMKKFSWLFSALLANAEIVWAEADSWKNPEHSFTHFSIQWSNFFRRF